MELREYVAIIWRWLWLIVLATAIAAASSFWASKSMPLVFQSSTTLMVGQTVMQDPNVTTQDLMLSQQLAQTYVQMATRQPILQATIESLGLKTSWTELRSGSTPASCREHSLCRWRCSTQMLPGRRPQRTRLRAS